MKSQQRLTKQQIYKIAGVTNEAELYAKYPSEEEFYAKCGKKIKAQFGLNIDTLQQTVDTTGQMANNTTNAGKFIQNFTGGNGVVGALNNLTGGNPIKSVMDTISGFKAQKEAVRKAKQNMLVMEGFEDAQKSNKLYEQENLQAAREKAYVRPEDNIVTGEELFPIYGVGTNVLAKKGKTIKAFGGASAGGSSGGGASTAGSSGGGSYGAIANQASGQILKWGQRWGLGDDMGSNVGGEIGGTIGGVFGPVGQAVGKVVGTVAGDLIDKSDTKIKKYNQAANNSMMSMMGMQMGDAWQNNFSANAENGKTVYGMGGSVKTFGEGSTTPISYNPYGGVTEEISGPSHAEGGVDQLVYNTPIEAEGGETMVKAGNEDSITIMGNLEIPDHVKRSAEQFTGEKFSGKKFKNVSKSIADAENKANRTMDRNINKADDYTPLRPLDRVSLNTLDINVKNADKKLQKLQIVKDGFTTIQEAMNEDKIARMRKGKLSEKAKYAQWGTPPISADLEGLPPQSPRMTVVTTPGIDGVVPVEGTNQSIKIDPINKTTRPNQNPIDNSKSNITAKKIDDTVQTGKENNLYGRATIKDKSGLEALASHQSWWRESGNSTDFSKPENLKKFQELYNKNNPGSTQLVIDGKLGDQMASLVESQSISELKINPITTDLGIKNPELNKLNIPSYIKKDEENKKKGFDWNALDLSSLWRHTDAQPFDNSQLIPEAWAMANNKLEPVQSQKFNPRLRVPYDISLQDQLNKNQGDFRMAERLAANNPGVLGNLKAQQYEANSRVLGEQFRQNQAMKDQVYSGNYATLNEADLKNLAIADTQYVRQEQAKSNTKATDFEAIKSMTDKRLKHNLENQTLKVWENMYDYRFGRDKNARYAGPGFNPADMWNTGMANGNNPQVPEGYEITGYNRYGQPRFSPKGDTPDWMGTPGFNPAAQYPPAKFSKNGTIVKGYKKFK